MCTKFDFSIDWLEFTYRAPECLNGFGVFENFQKDFPEIMKDWEVNADQVVLLDKGRNFYNTVFCFSDDYSVCYHSEKRNMGVHVTFPGHGIYKIAEVFGLSDLNEHDAARNFFRILDERNCEITRLDLAYDDFTKTFTPFDFNIFMTEGRITTESRVWSYIASGHKCGGTFYLGKRGRDRMIRIYDKAYESDGRIDSIRYEFELKKDWSRVVQNHILNDKNFCFADLLDSMFTIKEDYELSGDSHVDGVRKCRAGIDEKWQLFLDTIRKIYVNGIVKVSLTKKKEEYSFAKLNNWLRDYILPSLYMYKEVVGEEDFNAAIASAGDRLKPIQKTRIVVYKHERFEAAMYVD